MFLQKLSLVNFKNYVNQEFEFTDKINCFVGENGSGKTNILDAIYYLSFCKSYFNSVDSQNILHAEIFFSIHGVYFRNGDFSDKLSCIHKRNQRKKFKCNDKEYDRLADHIGLFPLVMISPYDRDLINDGSEIRRKFIDSVISQFDKVYLNDLIDYNRVLHQRNALLKKNDHARHGFEQTIDIWDRQLALLGEKIMEKRKAYIEAYYPIFIEYYRSLSKHMEEVELQYAPSIKNESLYDLLKASLHKDLILKYTSKGIHKDDLIFNINGYPVKKFGSQGQQKSFVLALRLAQFDYIKELKGFKPVILLDDIFDKLDDKRVQQIIKLVSDNSFGQVFVTDTQRYRVEKIFDFFNADHRIFEIEKGSVISIDS